MTQNPRPLKVTLISSTTTPMETLYYVWMQSRSNQPLPLPEQIELLNTYEPWNNDDIDQYCQWLTMLGYSAISGSAGRVAQTEFRKHFKDTIAMLLEEAIPVAENISFTFAFENCPITLREQLVRHRIGTHLDPRVGADIVPNSILDMRTIPDLAESSFWAQTSRIVPMSKFYTEGRYCLPESLASKRVAVDNPVATGLTESAEVTYTRTMRIIEEAYNALVDAGVPLEDARNLIPTGATHNITWNLNLKALLHIFGKRSSWVSQANLWEEVIAQMAQELITKVHPVLEVVMKPQCVKHGKYVGCPVNGTNVERVQGKDGDMAPCPLWVRYQTQDALRAYRTGPTNSKWQPAEFAEDARDIRDWRTDSLVAQAQLFDNAKRFSRLWNLDVFDPGLEV